MISEGGTHECAVLGGREFDVQGVRGWILEGGQHSKRSSVQWWRRSENDALETSSDFAKLSMGVTSPEETEPNQMGYVKPCMKSQVRDLELNMLSKSHHIFGFRAE